MSICVVIVAFIVDNNASDWIDDIVDVCGTVDIDESEIDACIAVVSIRVENDTSDAVLEIDAVGLFDMFVRYAVVCVSDVSVTIASVVNVSELTSIAWLVSETCVVSFMLIFETVVSNTMFFIVDVSKVTEADEYTSAASVDMLTDWLESIVSDGVVCVVSLPEMSTSLEDILELMSIVESLPVCVWTVLIEMIVDVADIVSIVSETIDVNESKTVPVVNETLLLLGSVASDRIFSIVDASETIDDNGYVTRSDVITAVSVDFDVSVLNKIVESAVDCVNVVTMAVRVSIDVSGIVNMSNVDMSFVDASTLNDFEVSVSICDVLLLDCYV
jgi:hypothetical protein